MEEQTGQKSKHSKLSVNQQENRRPNIIFILADDLGWGDLGCYGHPEIKTPNIDRLARDGTLFTDFYVNSAVCSPSRAAFTTGQFPAKLRIHPHLSDVLAPEQVRAGTAPFLDPTAPTLARMLKDSGYATGHFGKWHLGSSKDAPEPSEYGFESYRTVHGNGPNWAERESDPYFRAKSTGYFVDECIRFIKQNKDRPFYLNLWTLLPHAPLNPTPEQMEPFMHYSPTKFFQHPATKTVWYATIANLDAEVGRLLDKLEEMGLAENTIVIFSSDNGPEDIFLTNASHSGIGSPGPFRGRKRSLYDGGVRMPLIVRWPGRIPAGKVNRSSVLSAVDFLPSFTAIAGVNEDVGPDADGEDVSDILLGSDRRRTKPLMWEWRFGVCGHPFNRSPEIAIRDGDWKLLVNRDGSRMELYNIVKDPMELQNLAEDEPEVAARLAERVIQWQKTLPPGEFMPEAGMNNYPWPEGNK